MKCPNCNIPLMMTDRKGVEIDFCTECRGVWLDRGELDKIIDLTLDERSVSDSVSAPDTRDYRPAKSDKRRQYVDTRDRERYPDNRRKSFVGELFDLFD